MFQRVLYGEVKTPTPRSNAFCLVEQNCHKSIDRFGCSPQSSSDVRQATSPWRHQEELVGSSPHASTFPATSQHVLRRRPKLYVQFLLLYWTCCQLHVPTRSVWGTNKMIVSKQVHVLARSLSGLKAWKYQKCIKSAPRWKHTADVLIHNYMYYRFNMKK